VLFLDGTNQPARSLTSSLDLLFLFFLLLLLQTQPADEEEDEIDPASLEKFRELRG
jgi:hypothetical protein